MRLEAIANILTAFVNAGIVSVLIVAALWLLLRITPRGTLNAATRYAIWWIALATVIAMPLLYLPRTSSPAPVIASLETSFEPSAAIATSTETSSAAFQSAPANIRSDAPQSRLPRFPIEISGKRFSKWLAIGWLAISLVMLARLFAAVVVLQRRKSRAFAAPAQIAARLGQWLATCGTKRRISLGCSAEIATPMAAGLRSPSILIPAQLFSELDTADLDQIGLHETAHLARRDDYALIAQRTIEALFALHPVVRWIARRIDLEREIACDDFVIAATGRAKPYAACLTRVVELAGGVRGSLIAAAATEEPSHLARRVEMLLDKKRHTGTRLLKFRLIAAMAVLGVIVGVVATAPGVFAFSTPVDTAFDPWEQPPQPPIPPEPPPAPMTPAAPSAPEAPLTPIAPEPPLAPPTPIASDAPLAPEAPVAPLPPLSAEAPQAPPAPRLQAPYLIGAEDVLDILVVGEPDLSKTVRVRPDGNIKLPFIGDVQAAGRSMTSLATAIKEAYREKVRDPKVIVDVVQVNSPHPGLLVIPNLPRIAPPPPKPASTPRAQQGNFAPVAYSPQASPTPQAAPTPPTPAPSAPKGNTSYSVHSHNGEVDSDWHWRDGLNSRDFRMHGRVEFTEDESDVKSIPANGWFSYEESHAFSSRKYQAMADASGAIKRQYLIDGREHPFDDGARAWLRASLPDLLRESAIDAPERVRRLMKKGGANAVLDEIAKIHSSGARRVYIQELVPIGNLNAEQFQTILRDTRAIPSDGDKSSLLVFLSRYTLKDNLRDYAFDAASTINSSGDRRRVLMSFLQQDPSRATLTGAAKSAEQMPADGDKSAVLIEIAHHYRAGTDDTRRAFFRAAQTVNSSGDRARVLVAVIGDAAGDRDTLVDALHATAGIPADGDKARVLVQATSYWKDDDAMRRAFFAAANTVNSSGDRSRLLSGLAGHGGLSSATWIELIHSADRIPSDGDKTHVLLSVIERSDASNETLIAAVQAASRLNSEGEKARVLLVAIERSSGKPAVRNEIRTAVRSIHSDGEYRRVMSALDRQMAL